MAQNKDLAAYVNTLQGTFSTPELSYGNTYPTVAMPYPVHAFSPQTGKSGDGWKYQYQADKIRGFQQVHQCSPWVNDYAVFSLMPVTDKLVVKEDDRASAFSHKKETAKPYYYQVQFDNGINTEISPVTRGGHMKFTFPKGKKSYLVLDGYIKQSSVTIHPKERKITGWVHNGLLVPGNFKCYFEITFDKPFKSYGTWENRNNTIQNGQLTAEGDGKGAYLEFAEGVQVEAKIASSYISPEQATLTMKQELGKFKKFTQTTDAAHKAWNDLFNRVVVETKSEEDKATFYSCLFRANLFSHSFYEIDAKGNPYYYSPYDDKVHQGYMFTDNGFWDTFRAQFPLSNILHPTMQGRYMQSLLDAQEQSGWLPTWSCPGMSGIMIGNHAISLLTDAWMKGIRNFDPNKALDAYYHEVTNKGPWGGSNGREAYDAWFTVGYIPIKEVGESAAKTLEYSYDDFCAYWLAKAVGNEHYMKVFERQMYNYKNVYDAKEGFMRGKKRNGEWKENFNPLAWGDPFTEGNSWQYSWSVFHDVDGLVDLMGGKDKFTDKLDTFFNMKPIYDVGSYGHVIHEMREMELINMGQYAHGNQPVQHVAYLYNFVGQPWKSQYWSRRITKELYNATEKGYPGDEDQGGMSSWYILSSLGIYSVCPGTDQYVLGSPMFDKSSVKLENGKTFTIVAENNSNENMYIQSATLNGKDYTKNYITYGDINNGGTLVLKMGSKPNMNRGITPADKPFSVSTTK